MQFGILCVCVYIYTRYWKVSSVEQANLGHDLCAAVYTIT